MRKLEMTELRAVEAGADLNGLISGLGKLIGNIHFIRNGDDCTATNCTRIIHIYAGNDFKITVNLINLLGINNLSTDIQTLAKGLFSFLGADKGIYTFAFNN